MPDVANPARRDDKAARLCRLGVTVAERVPTGVHLSATNAQRSRRVGDRPHLSPPDHPDQAQ